LDADYFELSLRRWGSLFAKAVEPSWTPRGSEIFDLLIATYATQALCEIILIRVGWYGHAESGKSTYAKDQVNVPELG
jgi:hypothetical protein